MIARQSVNAAAAQTSAVWRRSVIVPFAQFPM